MAKLRQLVNLFKIEQALNTIPNFIVSYTKLLRLLFLCIGLALSSSSIRAETLRVFAASSLIGVLSEVKKTYMRSNSGDIKLVFAASSSLANQIVRGAPSDIFISANIAWVSFVEKQLTNHKSLKKIFLTNRLVLATQKNKMESLKFLNYQTFSSLIGNSRLAIGDPEFVPAGIYGKQALKSLDLWHKAKYQIAPTTNVRAALALIERNETPIGLIYRTDALNSRTTQIIYTFPENLHDRIEYFLLMLAKSNKPLVRNFFEFLTDPINNHIYLKFGFNLP